MAQLWNHVDKTAVRALRMHRAWGCSARGLGEPSHEGRVGEGKGEQAGGLHRQRPWGKQGL